MYVVRFLVHVGEEKEIVRFYSMTNRKQRQYGIRCETSRSTRRFTTKV